MMDALKMEEPPVNVVEQRALLRWVRATVEAAVRGRSLMEIPEGELTDQLRAPHGVFVTLKKTGALRGCIGKMDFERPLWANALEAAVASALEDPRFPPVAPEELPEITIEISVLNPPVDLPRPELFDPLRQGIIVQRGLCHALLLPKVAQEEHWDATTTLEAVCWKAGLPKDAWRDPATHLQIFTAFDFAENDPTSRSL
jgi:AmmeMemoRadiSam system protein A